MKVLSVLVSCCLIPLFSTMSSRADDLPPIGDDAFTIVILPDSQSYFGPGTKIASGRGKILSRLGDSPYIQQHREWRRGQNVPSDEVTNPYLETQIDWILENREAQRIVFVSHVGDVVELNREEEWRVAAAHLDRLRGVVPFGISVGNHDMEPVDDASLFQAAFPESSFRDFAWYGGSYDHDRSDQNVSRDNVNSYQILTAGGVDFLFLHLECNAPDDVLAWANSTIESHPDREVLITTHMDLGIAEKPTTSAGFIHDPKGRMQWAKRHGERGNTSVQMWEECFRRHANVRFLFSGDQSRVTAMRREDRGEAGNSVHALLSDYHSLGAIRLLRFDPGTNRVDVITYDTALESLVVATPYVPQRDQHQFQLEWDRK